MKHVSAAPENAPPAHPRSPRAQHGTWWRSIGLGAVALMLTVWSGLTLTPEPSIAAPAPGTNANSDDEHSRPYDTKLLRLAELLGSIHYLRELCGANEGQFWRDTMLEVMKSESTTAVRRARLTTSFNQGYRSYSRTYNVCTPIARATIDRFLVEGAELADGLIKSPQ